MSTAIAIVELLEAMESSSSSEDDDDDNLLFMAKIFDLVCETENHAKIRNYIDNVVSEYSDADFKKHFRLERSTCSELTVMFMESDFCPSQERIQGGGSKIYLAEDYILVFLWFAGNKASYRDVSDRFGAAESTLMKIINTVMDFLVAKAPTFIYFPATTAEKRSVADQFHELSGFPNVIGCMDGTYILIQKPVHKIRSTYINRHDDISITLQAICDSRKRFLDVFTGPPSRINDARIYRLSVVSNNLENICENTFHVLADGAYELREWLLTPYRNYEAISPGRKRYNDRFCQTRIVIENAFGILKKRFIQFKRLNLWDVDRITKFIVSCCVLHNICIDTNDDVPLESNYDIDDDEDENNDGSDDAGDDDLDNNPTTRQLRRCGEIKRNNICIALR